MIYGVGTDIIEIQKMEDAVRRSGKKFLEKIFTSHELKLASSRKDYVIYLAMRFAGKEAVFKAIRMGWNSNVKLTEIEIIDGKYGEPIVRLSGKIKDLAMSQGIIDIHLSLSYDAGYAIAFAVATKTKSLC
ncbi:MAG: holo-ACP synthase [Candidatus Bathyarchaeia archaeon]